MASLWLASEAGTAQNWLFSCCIRTFVTMNEGPNVLIFVPALLFFSQIPPRRGEGPVTQAHNPKLVSDF